MTVVRVGLIMHGVTGRMGRNQHLERSILAIRKQGGIALPNGDRIVPDPILVGRNAERLELVARETGIEHHTTDLDAALADPANTIFFDAASTEERHDVLLRALAAGKHIYCEKPVASDLALALKVARFAAEHGPKGGVVHDKLSLPGLRKLAKLRDAGFFGRILSLRAEFGYWIFDGEHDRPQQPSWNHIKAGGGGIILDMLCHWRYVLDNLVGPVRAVSCLGVRHLDRRWNEAGAPYEPDVEDAAYATFLLDGGVVAQINSSYCVRVRRDDLAAFQIDGTEGSAVAGLHRCYMQSRHSTPRPAWNPDSPQPMDFYGQWSEVPSNQTYDNAFKLQWEDFLRHVVTGSPFTYTLLEGAKGVQLGELAMQSWAERRWIDIPDLRL